jgi:hypothetical protein
VPFLTDNKQAAKKSPSLTYTQLKQKFIKISHKNLTLKICKKIIGEVIPVGKMGALLNKYNILPHI